MNNFVTFYVEDRTFGFDIMIVKEINPNVNINPVPLCDNYIRGLVNIRGQVVLVMDIAVMLGRGPRPITEESQIIILKNHREISAIKGLDPDIDVHAFGDKPIGLIVDRIGEVIPIKRDAIEPPPRHLDEKNSRFFRGVVRLGKNLLVILNAEAMIGKK